ncbi:multidrug effflux MFS transporter [Enterobacter soli]|uniref:multidrug effflux MFS transporter n=1 Tax=Enterobacter soli TaxID=885040 RepID=UPI0023782298|nr:multidrug effflux MFS transporter [Enterobacter soli]MDD9242493.1 multidrug effflux MFS transporter [Enterobacter soli]
MAKLSFSFAAILGLLTAIGPLCSDFYLPALPEIATHLHTSTTLTQLSLTSALIGLGLGQLFFGPLSDRMGRKMPLLISLLLFVVASVLCATTQNIYALIGWRFLQGVAGAGGSVLARSIARDNYHGTMLTQFFALLMTVNGIAPVVSPVLGGYISSHFDWRMLFWVMAGAGLALLIASQLFIRESLSEKSSAGTLLGTAKTVLKNRRFMRFCLIQAFMLAGLFSYIGASSFVLQNEYGLSAMQFSLLFGVNGIGLIISALIFSRLTRRHPSEGLMQIGLVLAVAAGALTLLFAWMHLSALALIALFFTVAFNSGISTIAGSEAMSAVEARESGTASAILGMLMFLFGGIAAPLAGIGGETMLKMSFAVVVSYSIALVIATHTRE